MSQNAIVALLGWPVLSLVFFAILGPWRGVITTYLGSYLLLSGRVMVPMSGLPDYTKFTAANLAALIGVLIFDAGRLAAFRPRWYDLAALVLCVTPVASFMTNGLDSWAMISSVNTVIQTWGIPYFIGRLYIGQPGADRTLAMALTLSGVLLVPALAFEVITEQSISGIVYGARSPTVYKYGLYSPVVMAANALEMGLWATLVALVGFSLWCTRSVSSFLGLPFGFWTLVLLAGPVLCHQTAALGFLGVGLFLIGMTAGRKRLGSLPELVMTGCVFILAPKLGGKLSLISLTLIASARYMCHQRPRLLIMSAALLAPVYLFLRATDAVSRRTLTFIAYMMLGRDRGQSLEFRIIMEERMVRHVMKMPLFGWATFFEDRAKPPGVRIVDSMWVIYLGQFGFVGLAALYGLLCLPILLMTRRRPVETWEDPRNGPVVGLIAVIMVYTFDSMLNAYNMITIPLIVGLVMGLPTLMGHARRRVEQVAVDRRLEQVDRLAALGRVDEAEEACHRLIKVRSADPAGQAPLADAYDRLADLLEALDRTDEADPVRRRALESRIAIASLAPGDPSARATLAGCYERLARNLVTRGRWSEAIEIRGLALEQRAALAAAFPEDPETLAAYTDGLNDLAWLLSVGGDPAMSHPDRAVTMAEQAVRLRPDCKSYWNTLGATYHRSGDPGASLVALRQSLQLGPDDTGFDEVLRALALASLGDPEGAQEALSRVDALIQGDRSAPASLLRLRAEASEALRAPVPAVVR